MIPAAHITGWWEQVARARQITQGMGVTEFGGTSCGPLSLPPGDGFGASHRIVPTLVQTLVSMHLGHYNCLLPRALWPALSSLMAPPY